MKKLISLAKETQRIYGDSEMSVYSGYTTLYILMAMVPLLTLVIGMVNLVPTVDLQNLQAVMQELLPDVPQVQTLFQTVIANVNRRAGTLAISVSVVASLWSASAGVAAIQAGLQKISGTGGSFVKKRAAALLYTLLFVLLIPALLLFRVLRGSIVSLLASLNRALDIPKVTAWLMHFMEYSGLITVAVMILVILLTYTFLQGERRKFRLQLPGAVFTTLLWLGFSAFFELFITRFWKASSLYGSLAAIFLAAMWLKTITMILFYGAALNEALLRQRRREETPEEQRPEAPEERKEHQEA